MLSLHAPYEPVPEPVRAQHEAALDTAQVDSVRLVRRARVELW